MVYYKFIYIISYNIESVNIAFWEKKKAGLAQAPVPLYFPYYYASFANLQGSQTLLFQRLTKWKFYTITNLQGSQTIIYMTWKSMQFYTITNLQGSQTLSASSSETLLFYTITNLQGSQTKKWLTCLRFMFYTITNLQGSQTHSVLHIWWLRFTPLQTYKVLKLWIG